MITAVMSDYNEFIASKSADHAGFIYQLFKTLTNLFEQLVTGTVSIRIID